MGYGRPPSWLARRPPQARGGQELRQESAGVAPRRGDLLGRAFGDDSAAGVAAFGAQVDHPVARS